jgi:hypothetical protein
MSAVGVIIDDSDLRRAMTAFQVALSTGSKAALTDEAEATRARIVDGRYWTNRRANGGTAASFKVTPEIESLQVSLGSSSKVARFLDGGTKAHRIVPKRKAALAFLANGARVVRRGVKHPGTKALRFIELEAAIAEPRAQAGVEQAAERAAVSAGLD